MKKYTMDDFFAGKINVVAMDDEETKILLNACDERGIRWANGGKASKWIPPIRVFVIFNGRLCYSSFEKPDTTVRALLKRTNYQITIDCDGDITTARMIINGKEVKQVKAIRNHLDKFNWKIGAQLAFDRLWGEKKPKNAKNYPFLFSSLFNEQEKALNKLFK